MRAIRIYFVSMIISLSALAQAGGDSSDGHTHGEAEMSVTTADAAPRASAQTEEFELVAVLEGGKLTLYLDRFATNEPVADAKIEIDSGAIKAVASQIAPGLYSVPGEAFANPGKYPLAISVQAGDSADLLTATLDLGPPVAGVEHAHAWNEWAVWGAAGALLLAGAGLVAMRRHKPIRRN